MSKQTQTMKDKICLVTGGSSGIGKGVALALAKRGATVVLTSRTAPRGEAAVAEIQAASGNQAVHWMPVDLLSIEAIHDFARAFQQRYGRLDVLINNAGGLFAKRALSEDGIEATLALNVLAPFVLTRALWHCLQASDAGRVLNVATKIGAKAKFNMDDPQGQSSYSGFGAYAQAKLGLIMLTAEMAARWGDQGVAIGCLHPGIVLGTEFGTGLPKWLLGFGDIMAKLFFMSTDLETSTQQIADLAQSSDPADIHGQYLIGGKPSPQPNMAQDPAARDAIWRLVEGWIEAASQPASLAA